MKTSSKIILSLAVFVSLSTPFNQSIAKQISLSEDTSTSVITYTDIHNYLTEHGYTVLGINQMTNGTDWRAGTIKDNIRYITIVHTNWTSIIGHEDVPM